MRGKFHIICCWAVGLLSASMLTGCESVTDAYYDDESIVYIYNYNEEYDYQVGLYLVSGDSLVDSCHVEVYPESNYDDEFEDVGEGYYYIAIFQDQEADESGRSGTFHLEEGEDACFWIDDDGDIKNCY